MVSDLGESMRYSVVTPVRDEEGHLPRLARSLTAQTVVPDRWVIVENGSTDGTLEIARELERTYEWVTVRQVPGTTDAERGAPIVRALNAGLEEIDPSGDVVVSVDADVSMDEGYFERLLDAFAADPRLGIASGSAYEEVGGRWEQRFVTAGTVWGATRAYRRACLEDVLPFEERHGWDGPDQLRARAKGWTTQALLDLPFRHHRQEGGRDGSRFAHWRACGESAHFMGYRTWYLVARTVHRIRREPAAVGLLWGFVASAVRRAPQLADEDARARLRQDQSVRHLLSRRREALGREQPRGE